MQRFICLVLAGCGTHLAAPDAATEDSAHDTAITDSARQAAVYSDLTYIERPGVDPTLLRLDLYVPAAAHPPLVVWVHGGAWIFGDKANKLDDKRALFGGAGYALASVNYRLSPNPPSTDPDRVVSPAHADDVAAAVSWLVAHAADYGIDTSRIALLGHSAGAHLVALVSTDATFGVRDAIRCTASFDTEAYDIPRALMSADSQQRAILVNAFTTDAARQTAASPIHHATGAHPRFLIARRGDAGRQASEQAFADAVGAGVIDATSLSHEEVNDHIGAPGDTIMTPPLVEFLTGCFE